MRTSYVTLGDEHEEELMRKPCVAKDATSMPWYRRYRALLQESLCCAEESMAECPALVMVAVATSDASPLGCFEQLDSAHYLPHNFQTGQYDPGAVGRVYLLVHDMSSGEHTPDQSEAAADPEMLLRQMRQRFRGIHCQLLLVNSLALPNVNAPDVWENSLAPVFFPDEAPPHNPLPPPPPPPPQSSTTSDPSASGALGTVTAAATADPPSSTTSTGGGVRGCHLSADDMLALKDLVHQLAIKEVVPGMEKRVTMLNGTVSTTRKGVKNVLKSWWRKPRDQSVGVDSAAGNGGGSQGLNGGKAGQGKQQVQYRFDQIENQILLLADSALAMRDVETALSNYRLVRDDFKSDKAFLHQGCCQVMVSICLGLLDGTASAGGDSGGSGRGARRESEASLRDACAAFQAHSSAQQLLQQQQQGGRPARKEVTLATRMATHASFLLADLLDSSNRHRESADVLVRASKDESNLSAAVLLEHAAWQFRRHGHERKFAFHVILAGIKFQSGGLERHAVRCFQEAATLYELDSTRWVHIQDYVHAHLAKHLNQLSSADHPAALESYLKIVGKGRQSAERQGRFVREFVDLCAAHPEALASVVRAQQDQAGAGGSATEEEEEEEGGGAALAGAGVPLVVDSELAVYEECANANEAKEGDERAEGGKGAHLYNASRLPPGEVEEWRTMALEMEAEIAAATKAEKLGPSHLVGECAKAAVELEENLARRR